MGILNTSGGFSIGSYMRLVFPPVPALLLFLWNFAVGFYGIYFFKRKWFLMGVCGVISDLRASWIFFRYLNSPKKNLAIKFWRFSVLGMGSGVSPVSSVRPSSVRVPKTRIFRIAKKGQVAKKNETADDGGGSVSPRPTARYPSPRPRPTPPTAKSRSREKW